MAPTHRPTLLLFLVALAAVVRESMQLNNGVVTPAMGLSTWNRFAANVNATLLMELADAMVSSGLLAAGYVYLNLDDGWAHSRMSNGTIIADPNLFPNGLKPVVDYVRSKGLQFGIYTARGSTTCCGKPGSDGYEVIDANYYASIGVSYLKEDSCGGTTHGTVWEQYARMRDALNNTGKPIYFSVTEAVPWHDGHPKMSCYGQDSIFTVIPWLQQGLDPRTLANSYLVEYCNNEDMWGNTNGDPQPGGFLSNLDSQQLLTYDNLTDIGAFNDNDMLECCNGGQSVGEYRAQFSTWAIQTSPLILGNDPRNMDADCLSVITNAEVIAVNQDIKVTRGKLVYQFPTAVWPNVSATPPDRLRGDNSLTPALRVKDGASPAPYALAGLATVPCNASDSSQLFSYNVTDKQLHTSGGGCVTYGGYHEANLKVTACQGWTSPGIGSQLWTLPNGATPGSFAVNDNPGKVLDLYDCSFSNGSVQVCTAGAADCYSTPGGPPGCGTTGQQFAFLSPSRTSSPVASAVDGFSHCLAVVPLPAPTVDIRMQIWVKHLHDGSIAAVAMNRSPAPLQANVTWELMGVPPTQTASVRDLWLHKDMGTFTQVYSATVPPHDVLMIRVAMV